MGGESALVEVLRYQRGVRKAGAPREKYSALKYGKMRAPQMKRSDTRKEKKGRERVIENRSRRAQIRKDTRTLRELTPLHKIY